MCPYKSSESQSIGCFYLVHFEERKMSGGAGVASGLKGRREESVASFCTKEWHGKGVLREHAQSKNIQHRQMAVLGWDKHLI
jgi:hypothetical protein